MNNKVTNRCSECGASNADKELRPYGVGGAYVCFECGMKDVGTTASEFTKLLPKGNALLTQHGPIPYIGPIPA